MTKILDPVDFGIEQQHLAKNINDAGDKDADNDAVDPRISHEGRHQWPPERRCQGDYQHHKRDHPNQEAARSVHKEEADR